MINENSTVQILQIQNISLTKNKVNKLYHIEAILLCDVQSMETSLKWSQLWFHHPACWHLRTLLSFPQQRNRPSIYDPSLGQKVDHAVSQPPHWHMNMLFRLLSYIYFILRVIILKHWKYYVCNVRFVSSWLNYNCESKLTLISYFYPLLFTYSMYVKSKHQYI